MRKFALPLNLQLFAEEGAAEPGVESASAAETQTNESAESQTGVESQAAAEPEKQNNFEKAFAKRLSEAQAKWEAEAQEKYKGYEDYKLAAEYLQKTSGINDMMTLREQIELSQLQERAEQANVPPEVLKRIDELEAKAAKADQFEQMQQQQQMYHEFRTNLEAFAKEKGADADELHAFMHKEQIGNMEVAYKAMRADQLEQQLANAEKEGVKKFLQAKGSIPTVPGSTTQGQVSATSPKTFAEARQRAMQRMTGEG